MSADKHKRLFYGLIALMPGNRSDFVSFSLALSVAPSPNPSKKEALYSVTATLWSRFCYVATQPFTRARKSSKFSLSLPADNLPRKRGKITEEKFENLLLLKVNNV